MSCDLSIVTTLYNSAPHLDEFLRRMRDAAVKVASSYEVILVNDGSPDHALSIARAWVERWPELCVVDLSRNYGHHRAAMAGLERTRGRRVFMINCDLEEAPEDLPAFWRTLDEHPDADVVFGVVPRRRGGIVSRVGGKLFYVTINAISTLRMRGDEAFSRLLTRVFVDGLLRFPERELYLGGLLKDIGFTQIPLPIETRFKGRSDYTLLRRVNLAINAITGFSSVPLVFIFYLGLTISLLTLGIMVWFGGRYLFFAKPPTGYTSLILSIWFGNGALISILGLVGIYLAKVFSEVKARPRVVVRRVYRREDDTSTP